MASKVVLRLFALILISLVGAGATMAAEQDFLAAAKTTLASQVEAGLPNETIDVWLAGVIGRQVPVAWGINDCGEQTGDPSVDKDRDFPVCGELEAMLGPDRSVYLFFSVGTQSLGVLEGRSLWFVGLLESDGTLSFESLSALAEHLRSEPR
jgi:hypothetical protein